MRLRKRSANILKTVICLTVAAMMITGCDKDFTEGTPFDNEVTNEATPGQNTTTPDPGTVATDKPEATKEPAKVTDAPKSPTSDPEKVTAAPEPSPTEVPTEQLPSPTETVAVTDEPKYRPDSFDRNESWKKTYLIYLPVFEGGYFVGIESKGTYDYATLSEVSESDVKEYITALKNAGFNKKVSEKDNNGAISFSAFNESDWNASVSYSGSALVIGSGFKDQDSKDEEKTLYSTTMLQYIPKFEGGEYISSDVKSDSTMYAYVIYGNVAASDVTEYINKLKAVGYIYGTDENYEEGSVWYIALNEESFECHAEYDGTNFKIGCGISEE